jgi:hypothetical protein
MLSDEMNARFVGLFILITYIGLILGGIILAPILGATDILAVAFPNATTLLIGSVIEIGNAVGVLGIALFMFPYLKKKKGTLALWYVGIRICEAMLSAIATTSRLALIDISEAYLDAGSPSDPIYQTLADIALANYHWAHEMLTVFFILGALLFYFILYRTEIVPKFISIWGFIAVVSLIIMNLFAPMLGDIAIIFGLPIMSNEIFLGIWLIAKGFNSSAVTSESEN